MVKYRVCVVHLWGQGFISRGILCIHVIDTADEYRTLLRYRVMIVILYAVHVHVQLFRGGGIGGRIAPVENHKWLSRLIGIITSVCNSLVTHVDNHCSCLLSGLSMLTIIVVVCYLGYPC